MNLAAIDNLIELKSQLKEEFTNAFGKNAFNQFYMGIGLDNAENRAFNPRLNAQQENLTPEIEFSKLHQFMTLAWMLSALGRLPESTPIYLETKAALLIKFHEGALQQLPTDTAKLQDTSNKRIQNIIDLMEETVTDMLTNYGYRPIQPGSVVQLNASKDHSDHYQQGPSLAA